MSTISAVTAAEDAERRVLDLVLRDGHRLVVVVSPPGAGKTRLIESLVAVAVRELALRVAVATPRTEQMYDLVRRLLANVDAMPITVLHSARRPLPADLAGDPRLVTTTQATMIPRRPGVVVSTVDKLGYAANDLQGAYDVLVCDEAYQMPFARYLPLTLTAEQVVLVGDPGQLPPLVRADTAWFEATPYRVHWPAPKELLARVDAVPTVRLPVTWRLPQDTVELIQPSFYPELPFRSAVTVQERRLAFGAAGLGEAIDRALDRLSAGRTVVALMMPERRFGPDEVDNELAALTAHIVRRLMERGAEWSGQRRLLNDDIGVVDAHVASGAAVRGHLRRSGIPTGADGVMVDTPEIWQGLQRPLMVVKHPMSGASRLSAFPLEPGRWCVALSRHQLGCIIVTRDGVGETLERHQHDSAERPTGADNTQWAGWRAHRDLWSALQETLRIERL
jgi:hypothetical protein